MRPKFEDCLDIINVEIAKRRKKWQLKAIAELDYDDVSQIIRLHIYKKWYQYKPEQPLVNWVNTIITNQIRNLIRNYYGNFSPPCDGPPICAANQGASLCALTPSGLKCGECALYKKWEKTKKTGYNLKLAPSLDNPDFLEGHRVSNQSTDSFDIEGAVERLHEHMKKELTEYQYKIYVYLYMDHKTENEVAAILGLTTTEKNRNPGYKQIHNLKKIIITKVKKVLKEEDVFYDRHD